MAEGTRDIPASELRMKQVLTCMVRGHFGLTAGEVWWMNHQQLLLWCGEELAQGSEVRIRVDMVTSADLVDCLVRVANRLPPSFCRLPKGFLHHGDFSLVDRDRLTDFHKDLARANPALLKDPTALLPSPLQRYVRSTTRSEHAAVAYHPGERTPRPAGGAQNAKDTLRLQAMRKLKRSVKEPPPPEARNPRDPSSRPWSPEPTPTPEPILPRRSVAGSETLRLKEILRRKAEKSQAKQSPRDQVRTLSGESLVVPLDEPGGASEEEFDAVPDTSTKSRRVKLSAGSLTPIQTHRTARRQERQERRHKDERLQEELRRREQEQQAQKEAGDDRGLKMGESGLRLDVEDLIKSWIEDTTKSAIPKPAREGGEPGEEEES